MAEANINFGPRPGIIGYPKRAWDFIRRWPVIPGVILALLVFSAAFAPIVAPHSPYDQSLRDRTTAPSWAEGGNSKYLLGTDHVGRDVLSRVIHGARISLMVTVVALGSGILIGVTLGLIAGWYGGFADEILARIVDIWLALPFLLVALVVVIVFGQSVPTMMLVLAMVSWSTFVRNVRAEVLTLKTRDYVELARVSGASTPRILIRHIIPGVVNTVFVIATLNAVSYTHLTLPTKA